MIGLYIILWDSCNYFYIGQSRNMHVRWKVHSNMLRKNKHYNKKLQNVYNKYGEPRFQVLEYSEASKLNDIEQWWLNEFVGKKECLNIAKDAKSCSKGRRHSEITIQKIKIKAIGRKHTKETLEKLASRKQGGKHNRAMPVIQYDLDGKFVAKFECIKAASDFSGCSSSSIVFCCRNQQKTSKGFIWRYATEKRNKRR